MRCFARGFISLFLASLMLIPASLGQGLSVPSTLQPESVFSGENPPFIKFEEVQSDEYIFLSRNKVDEPLADQVYRIDEGYYGILNLQTERDRVRSDPNEKVRPYLLTFGLSSCVAVSFYDPITKTGSLAHLYLGKPTIPGGKELNIPFFITKVFGDLSTLYGVKRENMIITIVWGAPIRTRYSVKRMQELILALQQIKPRKFRLDSTEGGKIRGVFLNIENGELKEINQGTLKPWSWSTEHDTTLSKAVDSEIHIEIFEHLPRIASSLGQVINISL